MACKSNQYVWTKIFGIGEQIFIEKKYIAKICKDFK